MFALSQGVHRGLHPDLQITSGVRDGRFHGLYGLPDDEDRKLSGSTPGIRLQVALANHGGKGYRGHPLRIVVLRDSGSGDGVAVALWRDQTALEAAGAKIGADIERARSLGATVTLNKTFDTVISL